MTDFPSYKEWAKKQPRDEREAWRYEVETFGLIDQVLVCQRCGYMYGWREAEDLPVCLECDTDEFWAGIKIQEYPIGERG